jgi:diacylglycerol kinase
VGDEALARTQGAATERAPAEGWLGRRGRSFVHAGRGVVLLCHEPNARIHLLVAVLVIALGVWARISLSDWALLVLAMALVLTAEALNTALEHLADAAIPREHPLVGSAKDLAAGAVLLAAVGAAVIGLLVLGPPVFHALESLFRR